MKLNRQTALIIANPQIDFFMGGAMEVPQAETIIPILNQWIPSFETVFVTMDWHPANHISFAANHPWRQIGQIIDQQEHLIELKPIHCVQNTFGARLHPQLIFPFAPIEIHKGTIANVEDGNAFHNLGTTTNLTSFLTNKDITDIYLGGFILEDNILSTALAGKEFGYTMSVISDASIGRVAKEGKIKLEAYLKKEGIGVN